MSEIDLLKQSLINKNATILLGAGFTYGMLNKSKKEIPIGEGLAQNLFNEVLKKSLSPTEISEVNQKNLKSVCDWCRVNNLTEKRDRLFCEIFTGCHPSDSKKLMFSAFVKYPWKRIFSLNIDDSIELLYQNAFSPLTIWNADECGELPKDGKPVLIKLHGCVRAVEHGFVFDSEEYSTFRTGGGCRLREYANSCLTSDIIILGSEYQESDIQDILTISEKEGYKLHNRFFFITPKINNPLLRRKIENTPNYHYIEWKTEQFLDFLTTDILSFIDIKAELKSHNIVFLDEYISSAPQYYDSDLYLGKESRYEDFRDNWDICRENSNKWVTQIIGAKKHYLFSIYGQSYVGKTCVAKRLLFDFHKKDYICAEYPIHNEEMKDALLRYLNLVPNGSCMAILCEGAAYQYSRLCALLNEIPSNVSQFVIISVDDESNHFQKKHEISYTPNCSIKITEKINHAFAMSIYQKLRGKNRLSEINKLFDKQAEACRFFEKRNDIIDVLYLSSEGRYFKDHFKDFYSTLPDADMKFFAAITTLGNLGITQIPLPLFSHIKNYLCDSISFGKLLQKYSDWITYDTNTQQISPRKTRILQEVITSCSSAQIVDLLRAIVIYAKDSYNDRSNDNLESELLQKALHTKAILRHKILSTEDLRQLFVSLEPHCKKYSYYWMQRGILEEIDQKFETAHAYLLNAQTIHRDSYQVNHALAKNDMERAVYEYETNDSDLEKIQADFYFERGSTQMKSLLLSKDFSNSFTYSLHALIDMSLKYNKVTHCDINESDCDLIIRVLSEQYDECDRNLLSVLTSFSDYCHLKGYDQREADLQFYIARIKASVFNDDIDYYDF